MIEDTAITSNHSSLDNDDWLIRTPSVSSLGDDIETYINKISMYLKALFLVGKYYNGVHYLPFPKRVADAKHKTGRHFLQYKDMSFYFSAVEDTFVCGPIHLSYLYTVDNIDNEHVRGLLIMYKFKGQHYTVFELCKVIKNYDSDIRKKHSIGYVAGTNFMGTPEHQLAVATLHAISEYRPTLTKLKIDCSFMDEPENIAFEWMTAVYLSKCFSDGSIQHVLNKEIRASLDCLNDFDKVFKQVYLQIIAQPEILELYKAPSEKVETFKQIIFKVLRQFHFKGELNEYSHFYRALRQTKDPRLSIALD